MHWQICQRIDEKVISEFPQYSPLVLQLLYNRNLKTQAVIDEFFNPDFYGDLHNPLLMKGVKEAVNRIKQLIASKKKIAIWGDYDADGICGTLVLKLALEALGAQPLIAIPDRGKEGYGLNVEGLRELSKAKVDLIITVDCGITDLAGIELAKSLGLEVIVTDHHQIVANKVPRVDIIINPHQGDDSYPFKDLSGAGVAYKLACALIKDGELAESWVALEKWLLDLVAIATIADMVPLLGENRTLVKYGLVVLNQTRRVGLQELIKQSGLSTRQVDSSDVAFVLSPRLNVASRMDHANMAFELISTTSAEEAKWLVQRLNQLNQERRLIVEKIVNLAEKQIKSDNKLILAGGENWPIGVLSLVASRLCDKYHRPAVIFSKSGNEIKGSCRSISSFNIEKALEKCADLLIRSGGHPRAAGLAIFAENLEQFADRMRHLAEEIKEDDFIAVLHIDAEVDVDDVSWQNYQQLLLLAPFGQDNEQPVFTMHGLTVSEIKSVGSGDKHYKLNLEKDGRHMTAIAFNFRSEIAKIKVADKISLAFEMLANEWNGFRELQLKVVDIKQAI